MYRSILIGALLSLIAMADPLYQSSFEADHQWQATAPALLSPNGRNGNCLQLSTYLPDAEQAQWASPRIPVAAGGYTVSAWLAHNLAFTQDMGYGGVLAAVIFDAAGKELSRHELVKIYRPPHRDIYDFYAIPEADGLPWNFHEAPLRMPEGAAAVQLVFAWSSFTSSWRHTTDNVRGEVYLDDIMIRPGLPVANEADDVAVDDALPFQLRVNTPVSGNVFLVGDPLEFTARLDGPDGPPRPAAGMTLHWRVEDFQRLLIASGQLPFSEPVQSWRESLLKTFWLNGRLDDQDGRWMAIVVSLMQGDQLLARGEASFTITAPRQLTTEQMQRSHFWGSGRPEPTLNPNAPWGPSVRYNLDEKQATFGVKSHGWDLDWKKRQPTAASPISFAADHPGPDYPMHTASQQTFEFHERHPLREHWLHYTQIWDAIPEWAIVPGRIRKDGDYIDPAAYGAYVEAYVRHTSATWYYITSPEGGSIDKFPNMARAAYAAVKRVDPRLKVVAQVDFQNGAAYATELCDSGLIDFTDVLVFDSYSSRMGQAVRDFRDVLEQRGKQKEYWIQEYCYTGSMHQEERTRRMVDYVVWAFANGVDKIRWYANHFEIPDIRAPLPSTGVVFGMNGMIFGQGEKLSAGMSHLPPLAHTRGYVKGNYMPFLQWCMYYQLQQHVAIEQLRSKLEWGREIEGALFDGPDGSSAAVWRPVTSPDLHMLVDSAGVPFTVTDMYGRRRRIVPVGGKALVTIGRDPLLFRFDGRPAAFTATPAPFELTTSAAGVAPGESIQISLAVANLFGRPWAGEVRLTMDDAWLAEPAVHSLALAPEATTQLSFTLTAPADATAGDYPLMLTLSTLAGDIGWLTETIEVAGELSLDVTAQPYTSEQPAAVKVRLHNRTASPIAGEISATGDFGTGMLPLAPHARVEIPPRSSSETLLPLADWVPSMSRDYVTGVTFTPAQGQPLHTESLLSFRGVPRAAKAPTIDGSLDDWPRDRLVPLPFFRVHGRGDAAWLGFDYKHDKMRWKGPDDASGHFYTQWDDDNLYFAFVFTDDHHIPGGKGVGIWAYDALHFLLYPWAVQPGSLVRGVPYKEHIGLDADHLSTFDRCQGTVGDWNIGSGQPEGVQIAVRREGQQVIMEFAVPFRHYAPLQPEVGASFALSLMYYDRDDPDAVRGDAIAWYYGQTNVDINPAVFGNFTLAGSQ